ncbi:MAG TPA: hypothetical protein VGD06_13775 [Acidobacteriota bacterium]
MIGARRALPKVAAAMFVAVPCLASPGWPQAPAATPSGPQQVVTDPPLHRLVHLDELRALRTFFERVDVSETDAGLRRPDPGAGSGLEAMRARLGGDWEDPFEAVRDTIGHVPYIGSVRGPRGVAESGEGNALDQALLLASLLESRGVPTRLMRGRLGWADAARLVLGTASPPAPQPDDPWPRWLEAAADHWWIQAQRDGQWIDLDPSFVDASVGERIAVAAAPHEGLPEELQGWVSITLYRGETALAEVELDSSALVGGTIELSFAAQSAAAVALWDRVETDLERLARSLLLLAQGRRVAPRTRVAAADPRLPGPLPRRRRSDFRRLFVDPEAGPWMARLQAGGRTLEAGPLEAADLDSLYLTVLVRAPQSPDQLLQIPWGRQSRGRLVVVVAVGAVSRERLALAAAPMHRSLSALARAEQSARDSMRPPIAYHDAAAGLRGAATEAWTLFERQAPAALGWAVLYGAEQVSAGSPAARVVRQGLRMVAVRWQPPEAASRGSLAVVLNDPVTLGQLTGLAASPSLRAANGLLHSAVLSQILNRLTDRAPETAFDVTLLAVGTGSEILPVLDAAQLPGNWPAAPAAEAARALRAGYGLLAPSAFGPDGSTVGWWRVGIADGETSGWVSRDGVALQGQVGLGEAGGPDFLDSLDSLLGTLPALHRAARWLAELPGAGPGSLSTAAAAACGSATVASDALREALPPSWPQPDVLSFCGPG